MTNPAGRARWGSGATAVALVVAACGGGSGPLPQPGQSTGGAPDLRGRSVILLPVQAVSDVSGDPDAELAYALRQRGEGIEWIDEDRVQDALARSPGIDTRTRGLPVGSFLSAQVRRVGDPLYGQLRRMAALFDADAVLLPVSATFEPNETVIGSGPRVRLTVALIEPRSGRVVWYAVEEGGEFPAGDPRGLATAVETLAQSMLWSSGG